MPVTFELNPSKVYICLPVALNIPSLSPVYSQQVYQDDRSSRSDSYPGSSTHETSSDQFNDLFDFSKIPDVDPVTRARLGSELQPQNFADCVSWRIILA